MTPKPFHRKASILNLVDKFAKTFPPPAHFVVFIGFRKLFAGKSLELGKNMSKVANTNASVNCLFFFGAIRFAYSCKHGC